MRLIKSGIVFVAPILIFAGTNAHAQLRPPVVNVNSEFGIAAQGFMQSYSETSPATGGTLDSEHGTIPGVQIKATSMFNEFGVDNLYVGFRYQYDGGGITYNGALLNGTPHNGTSHYAINDIGLEFGKGFLIADNVLITPFVQGGWRGWRRSLSSIQVEDYTHYYLGAGVNGDLGITDRLVLTGRLGIAETLGASMTSQQSVQLGLPEMNFKLGSTPLYQAGVGADYKFYTYLHLFGGVDYTHFGYGASPVNGFGFLEPTSSTSEVVFRVGIAIGL